MLELVYLKKIAICGTLASGKTTACQILAKLGAYVINADEIVHQLLSKDQDVKKKVVEIFGSEVLAENEIDRKKLGKIVFKEKTKLIQLEAILHPLVIKKIKETYNLFKENREYKAFVAEVPVLEKLNFAKWFDQVIFLKADQSVAEKRASELGIAQEEFRLRINQQATDAELEALSDTTIVNQGSINQLENQLKQII